MFINIFFLEPKNPCHMWKGSEDWDCCGLQEIRRYMIEVYKTVQGMYDNRAEPVIHLWKNRDELWGNSSKWDLLKCLRLQAGNAWNYNFRRMSFELHQFNPLKTHWINHFQEMISCINLINKNNNSNHRSICVSVVIWECWQDDVSGYCQCGDIKLWSVVKWKMMSHWLCLHFEPIHGGGTSQQRYLL